MQFPIIDINKNNYIDQLQKICMDLNKITQITQHIDSLDPQKFPQFIDNLQQFYTSATEIQDVRTALQRITSAIMNVKDVSPAITPYLQRIIQDIIQLTIKESFNIGVDAIKSIFDYNSSFYKSAHLDANLDYPIGAQRPLEVYTPQIGQCCDVIRPYITSTSYCGWTRCKVLSFQHGKYTVQYFNAQSPIVVRENLVFAPLGSRTQDFQWRDTLTAGTQIDALKNRVWYPSTIVQAITTQSGMIRVRVTFRRFSDEGDRTDSLGNKFFGLPGGEDEAFDIYSVRIQKPGTMANKKLCYYTQACDEALPDDTYQILFMKEYKQKPFHGIMRLIFTRSLSYLSFFNFFVANGGIQTLIKRLDDPNASLDPTFQLLTAIGNINPFIPRMQLFRYQPLYRGIWKFLKDNSKSLTQQRIDMAMGCFDLIGRRLYSLTEVYNHQSQLRSFFILELLQLNMEKQLLALRYMYNLINPRKKPSDKERQQMDEYLKNNKIFQKIFLNNVHEQILSRSVELLRYMLQREIVGESQIEIFWNSVPITDTRARAIIEKVLADVSKDLSIKVVQNILSKLLDLNEFELTPENLNLLRQLKNRDISLEYEQRILIYLWATITEKKANIPEKIEEEVEKVFKVFVAGIKDPVIREKVLNSMIERLDQSKVLTSELDLLKDFLLSYPQKLPMTIEEETYAPLTTGEAISYIKKKNVYEKILQLFENAKHESTIKEFLNFFTFLFNYESQDINSILKTIYIKLGPTETFFRWIQRISKRASGYMIEMLTSTSQLTAFENLSPSGYEALEEMIFDLNEKLGNLKIIKTKTLSSQGTSTQGPVHPPLIGPQVPEQVSHLFVAVSPSQIKGTLFLQRILPFIKSTKVYNDVIRMLVKFVVCLDDSISSMKEEFNKDFLKHIMNTLSSIIDQNVCDERTKLTIQAYVQIILQIFSETQKQGLGTLEPHFQQVQGQIIKLKILNNYEKNKSFENFDLKVNDNITIWKLKILVAEILGQDVNTIVLNKFSDVVKEEWNGKSLNELFYFDGLELKVTKKGMKDMPKYDLFTPNGQQLTPRFIIIIEKWFEQFKNEDNNLPVEGLKALSDKYWKGSLFREPERIKKIYEEYDLDGKGALTLGEFKNFFFIKATKNSHAIWKIINSSGYLNDLTHENDQSKKIQVVTLPRRILSCSQVYDVIFKALQNPIFEAAHPNLYKLLTMLEVDEKSKTEIKANAKNIITKSTSLYRVSYTLEVLNSDLAKKNEFFFEFYENNGLMSLKFRLDELIDAHKSIYAHNIQVKAGILPNLLKIVNMYILPIFCETPSVYFISRRRINVLDIEDLVKKQAEEIEPEGYLNELKEIKTKLLSSIVQFNPEEWYKTLGTLFHNMMQNYSTDSTDFVPRITTEVVRGLTTLILGTQLFKSTELIYGLKTQSLNYRRSSASITYMYMNSHQECTEELLLQLLKEMPTETKGIFSNYFQLLSQIVGNYTKNAPVEKDGFLIELVNQLLNKVFELPGQSRTALISDKVILGSLMTVEMIISRKSVCQALIPRKYQIVQKLLFFYNAKKKIEQLQIPIQCLSEQKQKLHFQDYVKCKTEDTRKYAYKIVQILHEASREKDPNFLEEFVLPIIQNLPGQSRKKDQKTLHVGLQNFGSTCYMNSMLQILNSVTPFRNLLMQANVQAPLIQQLKQLFSYIYFSERIDYAPRKLLDAFVPPINPSIQQDTTEFLNQLFDGIENALVGSTHRKLLDEIFKGAYGVQMICHSCGAKRQNRQQFFQFSVEIDGKIDLGNALDGLNQGQVISDFYCESCNNRGDTTKRNLLSQIPSIFFVHLRRIVFNYDAFANMKIHTRLAFPQEFNIEPYTKEGVELRESLGVQYMKNLKHNEEEQKKFDEMTLHSRDKDYYKMNLKGVIVHSGSADVGHYYSIVPNPTTKGWLKLDDSRSLVFPSSGFQNQCFGGSWTNEEWGGFGTSINAYFLIYERVQKNPIRVYSEMNEPEVLKFDEIKTYNTPERYKQVWLDNHQFLQEIHLLESNHGKRFIEFVCQVLKNSQTGNQIKTVCEILYKISMFSEQVGEIGQIFDKNVPQINAEILKDYIFADKKKTFNLLFHHQKNVRDLASNVIHGVLIKCYRDESEEIKEQVINYIKELLQSLSGEVAKNWLRVDGYFKLFFRLLVSSVEFMQMYKLFLSFDLIATFIDFIMEKNSPVKINPKKYSIGTKTSPVDFRYGLQIICYLLRRSYGFTGTNHEEPPVPQVYLFHLSDNAISCLSCLGFYEKMISQRQNHEVLASVIQRLCIKNIDFSKAVIRILLSAVCANTDYKHQMREQSVIIEFILVINDGFWRQRAEALLGLPSPNILNDNGLTTLDEERFTFASTLYDIFPVECLLNYVNLYRLKNSIGCFEIIRAIVKGCCASDEAMYFLARQPSVSYYNYNYVDWLLTFVPNFINFLTMDEKKKSQLQKQIDEVVKNLEDVVKFASKNTDKDLYKSVITGTIFQKQIIQTIVNEEQKVQILVHECEVYCVQSKPTHSGNQTLDGLLDGGRITKPVSDESSILKIMSKPNKKALALKMKPVQEDEDADLVGLFDSVPDARPTVHAQTTTNPVASELPQSNPQNQPKMQEEQKQKMDEEPKKEPDTEEKEQKIEEEPVEQIIDLQGIYSTNYFRQIEIVNKSKVAKFVKLIFENEQNSNVILPTSLSFKVGFKNSEKIWFSKQVVNRPYPQFKIITKIQDFVKDKKKEQWFKIYGEKKVEVEDDENAMKPQEEPKKQSTEKPKDNTPMFPVIECPYCTYINYTAGECEVCGNLLPN